MEHIFNKDKTCIECGAEEIEYAGACAGPEDMTLRETFNKVQEGMKAVEHVKFNLKEVHAWVDGRTRRWKYESSNGSFYLSVYATADKSGKYTLGQHRPVDIFTGKSVDIHEWKDLRYDMRDIYRHLYAKLNGTKPKVVKPKAESKQLGLFESTIPTSLAV